jgi:hypothetical protein
VSPLPPSVVALRRQQRLGLQIAFDSVMGQAKVVTCEPLGHELPGHVAEQLPPCL